MKTNPLKGLRVLIAEDDVLIGEAMRDVLIDLGCKVVGPIDDLGDVLRTIASCELDAALLDVRFGEASILPAAIALKAKKIPYILTTGSRDLTDLPALLANAPLLTKPFDARRLEMMMGTALLASDGAAPHRL